MRSSRSTIRHVCGQLGQWKQWHRGQIRIVSARHNSTINIQPINVNTTIVKDKVEEFKSVTSLLNSYVSIFPREDIINSKILEYKSVKQQEFSVQTINVGVIYNEDNKSSKIIETLLADPLSSNNKFWLDAIEQRNRQKTNRFKYGAIFEKVEEVDYDTFYIPSPVLSAEYRQTFQMSNTVKNDIQLVEFASTSFTSTKDIHFYINVTNDFSISLKKTLPIHDKILITVVDNTEYTPSSTESTPVTISDIASHHILKLNSTILFKGIEEFLIHDTEAASIYLDSLKNSNIYELLKVLEQYTESQSLLKWLYSDIVKSIDESIVEPNQIVKIRETSTKDINQFADSVHNELQHEFIPSTERFFRRKLSWWKLYLKNDNIEYEIKDFFNKNFMNKSIEKYNYLNGQIDSKFNEVHNVTKNPLLSLKNNIINERIANEIQPIVYRAIVTSLLVHQIPISIISFLSYYYFEFSANSAIALALLGWIIGFNNVSKTWVSFSKKWLNELFEEIRLCISQKCIDKGLAREINQLYTTEMKRSEIKSEILKGLNELNK
ncbi:uncharacterized protein RJT21DRAFT_123493 [Scheffersomyces amazonensis]|uniref:uncharacterized protein n=1 Tax=Scheffersomyces amazonensis TaxID=1078765 RepID=UPI00315D1941